MLMKPAPEVALGHESVLRTGGDGADAAGDLNVLGQVEVVGSGLARGFRDRDVAVIREARDDGVDGMLLQVFEQCVAIGRVQGERGKVARVVGTHHGFRGGTIDVAEVYFVTTGFC